MNIEKKKIICAIVSVKTRGCFENDSKKPRTIQSSSRVKRNTKLQIT